MFAHCSTRKKTQLMCYGWNDCGRTFSSLMPGGHYRCTQQSILAWYHQFQNFTVLPHTYSSYNLTVLQYLCMRLTGAATAARVWSKSRMFGCSQLALQWETG